MGKVVKAAIVGAAIATGVGFFATPALVGGASFLGLSGVTAYFAQSFVINAVLGLVSSALAPKPSDITSAADLSGRLISSRNPIASRKLVYGQVKTAGTIVFMEATNSNKDMHVAVTLAAHEITAIDEVDFFDKQVATSLSDAVETAIGTTTDPNYSGKAWVTGHFGTADQVADANLVSRTSMTTDHRLRGIAYIYGKFTYNQDVFSQGIPNISCLVRGRKVYDPRTLTTGYSNNAALCILDYIRDDRYGLNASDSEVDFDSFITAANICDEPVTLAGGGTEPRYTINGVVDTSKSPAAILNDLLTACAGIIYYSNGQYKIKAGAYVTPVDTLTTDDFLSPIDINTRVSNQANFNAVKGIFVSPDDGWQPVDYPVITSSVFEAEDNGDRRWVDLTLPYTTSPAMAQRLAKIALYRNREQITLNVTCKLTAFKYEIGDTLFITAPRLGFNAKVFEVLGWSLSQGNDNGVIVPAVQLALKETSTTVYSWAAEEKELTRNNTTLPSATTIAAPVIAVSDELRSYNQEVITTLIASITTESPFAERYEVQAMLDGTTDWISLGQSSGLRFELVQVEDNAVYQVRARAISSIGVRSEWATVNYQVIGKTAPPSDVTGLTGNLIGNQYVLTWDAVSDLDLSHYRVRFASAEGAQNYENSVSLVPKVARPATTVTVPARNGTYFVKAVDKLDFASDNAATIVLDSSLAAVENLNTVATLTEHPSFSGTYTSTILSINGVVLDTAVLFDDVTGNFDDAPGQFDAGGGNIATSGYYNFANDLDLGDVFISRVTAILEHLRIDYVDLFDSAIGLFDDRPGSFDGDPNSFDDTDAIIEVRTTLDDPAGAPTWSAWQAFRVGDYKARAFEFRVLLTTIDAEATPAVSKLQVSVDMPDRVVSENDLTTTAAAYNVTFPNGAFNAVPAIGIGAQDLATGDYYEISSKTVSGFIITFKNSSGTAVARSFDYVARGYGRVIS